jgi:hypothetical protein
MDTTTGTNTPTLCPKKRTPHFQSDSEIKYGVLGNSDLYQSIEELPEFCFK